MNKPVVPQRSKSKISQIAAQAAISFRNLPFSPGRDNHLRPKANHHHKGFSGPLVPNEARVKVNSIEADQEPTSPRVSCIGQIKHKKNKKKKKVLKPKHNSSTTSGRFDPDPFFRPDKDRPAGPAKGVKKIFGFGRKSFVDRNHKSKEGDDHEAAPSLGQMRKFASSRDALADFDWMSTMRNEKDENSNLDNEDDDVAISFSGPIFSDRVPRDDVDINGTTISETTKKEISLWKRRTMAQPKPLQLNMVRQTSK